MALRFRLAILPSLLLFMTSIWTASSAQDARAPNMFKDVALNHWAYAAVDGLRTRNVVSGYPETYFRSNRALTRFEFAVAVDRAMKNASTRSGGSVAGSTEAALGDADVSTLRRLAREFRDELASLGTDERAVARALARTSRTSASTEDPMLAADSGGHSAVSSGRPGTSPAATLQSPRAWTLGAKPTAGNLNPTPPARSSITLGTFNPSIGPTGLRQTDSSGMSRLLPPPETLTAVRVGATSGRLTLGAFYGGRAATDPYDPAWSALLLASANQPQGFSLPGGPLAIGAGGTGSAGAAGVEGGVGFRVGSGGGQLSLSALTANRLPSASGGPEDVTLFSANSDIRLANKITLSADWARSLAGTSRLSPTAPTDSESFNASVDFRSSGLNLSAGYRYVDPLFYTPGYWGHIGTWLNPTNIQGPSFRGSYDVTSRLGLTFGGDYYTAARDNSPVGLDANEEITRALLGVRLGLSRTLNLTADYEGVFWSLNGSRGAGTGMFHPTEHYITLGTGFNITGSTLLRLNYQIGDLDGHGTLNYGSSSRSKFNAFVGQVNVKF